MNKKVTHENEDQYYPILTVDDEDYDIFSTLTVGGQSEGQVTADLGWAWCHLTARFGIESHIGLSGFDNPSEFKRFIERNIGIDLHDWEGSQHVLYECWMPCLHDQFPDRHYQTNGATTSNFYDEQVCYIAWRASPDPDAYKFSEKIVYALKHKAFQTDKTTEKTEFKAARCLSLENAILRIRNVGKSSLIRN